MDMACSYVLVDRCDRWLYGFCDHYDDLGTLELKGVHHGYLFVGNVLRSNLDVDPVLGLVLPS